MIVRSVINPKLERIYFTACWHVGNAACRWKLIQNLLNLCKKDKHCGIILGGDLLDAITLTDKRIVASIENEAKDYFNKNNKRPNYAIISMFKQAEVVGEALKPVASKILGIVMGNHEYSLGKIGNVYDVICKIAGINYDECFLGGCGYIHILRNDRILKVFCGHSRFRTASNIGESDSRYALAQERLRRYLAPWGDADVKLIAHAHHGLVAPPVYRDVMSATSGKIQMKKEVAIPYWCAVCPSMFAGYDRLEMPSYAEIAMLLPNQLGYVRCDIDNKTFTIKNVEIVTHY